MIRPFRQAERGIAAAFSVVTTILLAGCGGGGGGSSSSGTPTPAPSVSATTRVKVTVNWGSRSRAVTAPNTAQSAVLTLPGGLPGGSDFTWTFTRDTSRADAYTDSYISDVAANKGQYTATLRFFSGPNGTGTVIGIASKTLDLSTSSDFGDVSVTGIVATVEVPAQHVGLNASVPLTFSLKDANGGTVSAPSISVSFPEGGDKVRFENNQLIGIAAGTAKIVVTAGGVSSTPATIAVGDDPVSVGIIGSRGYLLFKIDGLSGAAGGYLPIDTSATRTVNLDWLSNATFTVPDGYGDRQFVKWQINGADAGTSPTLSISPLAITGPVTAVFAARPAPTSGFVPNFNKAANQHWAEFPIAVYLAPNAAASQDTIKRGFDRWVAATGGFVNYSFVTDPAQAQVTFKLSDDLPDGLAGICQTSYYPDNLELVKAEIRIRPSVATQDSGSRLEGVAAHEFGHALGMTSAVAGDDQGHSSDPNDTMYPSSNPAVGFATARDVNTLTNLYAGLSDGRSRAVKPGKSRAAVVTTTVGCNLSTH